MITLTPPQQNTQTEHWLTAFETLCASGSNAKTAFALIDKSSVHFLLGFPRPINGRWLESDVKTYLAAHNEVTKL